MRRIIAPVLGIALLLCSEAQAGHTCSLVRPGKWVCTTNLGEPTFDDTDDTPSHFRNEKPDAIALSVTVDSVCPFSGERAREVAGEALGATAGIEALEWPGASRGWFGLDLRLECATLSQVSADLAFVDMINGRLSRYGEFYLPGADYDELARRNGRPVLDRATLMKVMEGSIRSVVRRFVIANVDFDAYQTSREGVFHGKGCRKCAPGLPDPLRIEEEDWLPWRLRDE